MRILISNDDGYLAPGISALARALEPIAEIAVVAPDSNRSGASSSLTLERPISVYQGSVRGDDQPDGDSGPSQGDGIFFQ